MLMPTTSIYQMTWFIFSQIREAVCSFPGLITAFPCSIQTTIYTVTLRGGNSDTNIFLQILQVFAKFRRNYTPP
jgi:hypothetical protein